MINNLIGVGIFLLGIKYMSDGMQEFTDDQLRKFLFRQKQNIRGD
mgnify:CR=1 FL=1